MAFLPSLPMIPFTAIKNPIVEFPSQALCRLVDLFLIFACPELINKWSDIPDGEDSPPGYKPDIVVWKCQHEQGMEYACGGGDDDDCNSHSAIELPEHVRPANQTDGEARQIHVSAGPDNKRDERAFGALTKVDEYLGNGTSRTLLGEGQVHISIFKHRPAVNKGRYCNNRHDIGPG